MKSLQLIWRPGTRPTKGNSIEFEIRSNFGVLWFDICSTERNEILHTSRQLYCRDVCKISLWSAKYVLIESAANFGLISNSIEISLVGRAPSTRRFNLRVPYHEMSCTDWTSR